MKKKILAFLMSLGMTLFGVCSFSSCEVVETLNLAVELEILTKEVESLRDENASLKSELATLKFESAFPNGLVTESCVLNSVEIIRDEVNTEGNVYAVKADGNSVGMVINGGYYDGGSGSASNIAVWAHDGAHVVIRGGDFTCGADSNGDANPVIYASGGSIIEIMGGFFKSNGDSSWLLNCQNNTNSSIIVAGGIFVNFNPAEAYTDDNGSNAVVNYLAEGYTVKDVEQEDGSIWYIVVKASEVEEVEPEVEDPKDF